MKNFRLLVVFFLILPVISMGQLKKDVTKPNISNTLTSSAYSNGLLGFLDPSRFEMHHSFSMSFMTLGGGSMMVNTYMNTLNYRFSDKLFLATNLGIMNSPYNSFSGTSPLNQTQFFGGAELTYLPTKNTVLSLRFDYSPYMYQPYARSPFYNMNNFSQLPVSPTTP
jgi:hypothetical protein